ncbi:hypothetical protein D3C72_2226740 [compost metagenome]
MTTVGFDLFDHFFDVLHGVAIGNQHRIFGLDDDQIFHAHRGHKTGFSVNIAIFCFVADHIAVMHVAFRRVCADFPQ